MSGRIRTIKPELLEDAITAGLSDCAFRLFIACITLADDYGNLRFEAAWLRGQVYWKRPIDDATYFEAFAELAALIDAYEVKGQRYGAIRNWDKHQRVSHPGKPRVPGPPAELAAPELEPPTPSLTRPSGESPETLVPDLRSPITDLDHERDHSRARVKVADAVEAPDEPPPWVDDAIATVADGTGETFDRVVVWLAYSGKRSSENRPLGARDFQGFLARWAARQKQERVNAASRPPPLALVKAPPDVRAPYHAAAAARPDDGPKVSPEAARADLERLFGTAAG